MVQVTLLFEVHSGQLRKDSSCDRFDFSAQTSRRDSDVSYKFTPEGGARKPLVMCDNPGSSQCNSQDWPCEPQFSNPRPALEVLGPPMAGWFWSS